MVMIHDVFHYANEPWQFEERSAILSWLTKNKIKYITASPTTINGIRLYEEVVSLKERLRIREKITQHNCNPMIFFLYKKVGTSMESKLGHLLNTLRVFSESF